MKKRYKFKGKPVDIIEMFDLGVVVQDVESKDIFTILYDELDSPQDVGYNNESNIISLKGWKEWQRKTKKKNQKK